MDPNALESLELTRGGAVQPAGVHAADRRELSPPVEMPRRGETVAGVVPYAAHNR
jgi:hypothetical protein